MYDAGPQPIDRVVFGPLGGVTTSVHPPVCVTHAAGGSRCAVIRTAGSLTPGVSASTLAMTTSRSRGTASRQINGPTVSDALAAVPSPRLLRGVTVTVRVPPSVHREMSGRSVQVRLNAVDVLVAVDEPRTPRADQSTTYPVTGEPWSSAADQVALTFHPPPGCEPMLTSSPVTAPGGPGTVIPADGRDSTVRSG